MSQLVPIFSYRVDTSSMWKNWNTDDTDLTDEHGFFSALPAGRQVCRKIGIISVIHHPAKQENPVVI